MSRASRVSRPPESTYYRRVEPHCYIEYLGNSVELPLGETIVGRDVGCRLRFNDPAVSRRHLRFVRRQDELFVEDLNSSNGTLLNGQPLTLPVRIQDADVIQVGERTLILRMTDEDAASLTTLVLNERPSIEVNAQRARTEKMRAVTGPPPNKQKCPKCGATVSANDDECTVCRFAWGGFRAGNYTEVRKGIAKRRHERFSVELPLVYVSSELEIEATSLDLSPSGVFVCSQVLDPVGTPCDLTFLVDGGPPLAIAGIVRRVVEHDDADDGETGLGVEFTRVGPAERAWLDAVIARQATPGGR